MTLEYATDQLTESLQRVIRRAVDDPAAVAADIGIDVASLPDLVLNYGVDVVYGSNLKDVEAVARSFDSQIQLDRPVNAATPHWPHPAGRGAHDPGSPSRPRAGLL